MIDIQNLLLLIFKKIEKSRLDGLVPDNSLPHFVISTPAIIRIVDAAYKALEYNVQSLIRFEIVWNGQDVIKYIKKNAFIRLTTFGYIYHILITF